MNNLIPALALGAGLLAIAAAEPAGKEPAAAPDKPEVRELKVGEKFTWHIDSNPSTGYDWQLPEGTTPKHVKLVKQEYVHPKGITAPGAGGTTAMTFEAVSAGSETVTLVYKRAWEKKEAPARQRQIAFVVKAK